MQFLCLVHFAADAFEGMTPEDQVRLTDATIEHDHNLAERGHLIAARPLTPLANAVTVQRRRHRLKVTDGPYAESKEVIGGFILIDARDRDEAIALMSESPIAEYGTIEIRPLVEQTHSQTGAARPTLRPLNE